MATMINTFLLCVSALTGMFALWTMWRYRGYQNFGIINDLFTSRLIFITTVVYCMISFKWIMDGNALKIGVLDDLSWNLWEFSIHMIALDFLRRIQLKASREKIGEILIKEGKLAECDVFHALGLQAGNEKNTQRTVH